MRLCQVRANYYQQGDADYSRPVPAEAFGGWKPTCLEISLDHTAVVVMHAYTAGTHAEFPVIFRTDEYPPRADRIAAEVFPPLLNATRAAGIRVFHVVGGGNYYQHLRGYQRAVALADAEPVYEQTTPDPAYERLTKFRTEHVMPGFADAEENRRYCAALDFYPSARPAGDEGIALTSNQLFALCKAAGVNHLIYAGFAINWCLLLSGGGMADMQIRRRLICSAFRQAVTAVENKETARREQMKEEALWRVATNFGFVFDVDDFIADLGRSARAEA